MFKYKLSLKHVHDLIEVREGDERLVLRIDADPVSIVHMINKIEPRLNSIHKQEEAENEAESIAREYCGTIFGRKQMMKLFELYNGNAESVLDMCCRYTTDRLIKLITKAQKKAKL